MSDTPETDGLEAHKDDAVWRSVVPSKFAMRLERERNAAREELALVRKQLICANRGAEKNAKINQGLCARLAEAERERDEARRYLVGAEELHRRRFGTLKAEYDAACTRFAEAERERDEARRERDEARRSLKHIEEYGAEKINAAVSLRQELTKAMETDWTAIGYREGMSAALHSGGIRGAKWHAERKGIQGEAADNYISGFNAALDEYEQEKA